MVPGTLWCLEINTNNLLAIKVFIHSDLKIVLRIQYELYRISFQVQKSGSTRKRTGFQYLWLFNELIVREVPVLKFQTSVGTLKLTNQKGF